MDRDTGRKFRTGKVIYNGEFRYVIPDRYQGYRVKTGEISLCCDFSKAPLGKRNEIPIYAVKIIMRSVKPDNEIGSESAKVPRKKKLKMKRTAGTISARNEFILETTGIGTFIRAYDKEIRWNILWNLNKKKPWQWFATLIRGSEELVTWQILDEEEIAQVIETIQKTKLE